MRPERNEVIMAKVIILGSANAIADKDHEHTHLVIVGRERVVLVDSPSNPILRLEHAGVDANSITDLIITHFHPDHVSGVPIYLMEMWLLGRRAPLEIFGLDDTLDRLEKMMALYSWDRWPNFYPVHFNRVPAAELSPVLDCPDFKILSSPVKHLIPTIGLRVEFSSRKVFAYSCDTEPCDQAIRLSADADVLLHESSGATEGHSSAAQAGDIAARANAARLFLIHYPNGPHRTSDLIAEAQATFSGQVFLAEDFASLEF
jgi:ribonuclease Z